MKARRRAEATRPRSRSTSRSGRATATSLSPVRWASPIGGNPANGTDATQISDFSNRAGAGAEHYLAALGYRVRTFDETGAAFLYNGTSFAAPVISGAAALLASAFPNLTGAQIVKLLLTTANDAGAAGRDDVFGNGILNIQRAFQPQGQTTLAGSSAPVSTTSNGTASGPMGDGGKTPAMAGAIILDGYSRAYAIDLAKTLARAPRETPLAQSLQGDFRTAGAAAGKTAISITVNRDLSFKPGLPFGQSALSHEDARRAKVVAGMAISRLTPQTAVAFGFSESGRSLQQRLSGQSQNAFLVARDPMTRSGFYADDANSIGVRHSLGRTGLTVTGESGKVWNRASSRRWASPATASRR
jgi:hypothetical protein